MKRLGTKPSLFILSGAWGVNRGVLIVTIDKIKKMIRECEGFNPHCRGVLIVTITAPRTGRRWPKGFNPLYRGVLIVTTAPAHPPGFDTHTVAGFLCNSLP